MRLIKAARRLGYHGLAVVIAIAWDRIQPRGRPPTGQGAYMFRWFQNTEGEDRQDCNWDIKRQDTPTDGQLS